MGNLQHTQNQTSSPLSSPQDATSSLREEQKTAFASNLNTSTVTTLGNTLSIGGGGNDAAALQLPDFSLDSFEDEDLQHQRIRRRGKIFILHLNIFLFLFICYSLSSHYSNGSFQMVDVVHSDSAGFSYLLEFNRWLHICTALWFVFLVLYWAITGSLSLTRLFVERKLGRTTIVEIAIRESYKMELHIHYLLISIAAYLACAKFLDLDDHAQSNSEKKHNWKYILMNFQKFFLSFSYPESIQRFIYRNAVFSVLFMVEHVSVRTFAINFYFNHFQDRITKSNFLLQSLQTLRNQLKKLKRTAASNSSTPSVVYRRKPGIIQSAIMSLREAQHHLQVPESYSQQLQQQKNQGIPNSNLTEQERTRNLGNALFSIISSFRGKGNVAEEDFEGLLPGEDARKFFSFLQMHTGCEDEKAFISKQQFLVFFESIQQEKSNLLKCVSDQENITKQLNSGCLLVVLIIWAAFCYSKFVLILFPLLYVVKSVFYDVLQEVVNAGVFVFFKHPFDVGDSIYLNKIKYQVASIDFMTSTLLGPEAEIVYINNCELDKYLIYNIRRAGFQYENFHLSLHPAITSQQMAEFEWEMSKFVKDNPQDYRDYFQLWGFQIINSNRLDVTITLRYACNKHFGDAYTEKKSKFQLKIKNSLERLQIPLCANQF